MTESAQDLWGRTLAHIRGQLASPGARAWVENARPVAFADDRMVLAVGSSFAKERLERSAPVLSSALAGVAGRPIEIQVTVDERASPPPPPPDSQPSPPPAGGAPPDHIAPAGARRDPGEPVLNPKYTFETFVIGESNRFAHAAAMAVAEQPARSYNPLFIYGDAGLGKTHLLHAIGHGIRRLYPKAVVRYVSSEQFMNDFIQSVREERMPLFRRRYREADVLLIDDVQFLVRGEQTQEEFFHTFNALHNDGRQIVLTSDRAPKQITPLEDRLRTRFEWGLLADVRPPDLETRVAILQKKAAAEGYVVPDAVLDHIATRVQNNIRELEGRLIRVVSYASLSGLPLTLELAQEVLRPLLPPDGSQEIPPDLIIEETAAYFSLSRDDLLGPLRTRPLVEARQVAMYLCRELTPLSLPKIGEIFGGRDHTTVLYADGKIRRYMRERRATYQQVQELTARIRGRATAPAVSE